MTHACSHCSAPGPHDLDIACFECIAPLCTLCSRALGQLCPSHAASRLRYADDWQLVDRCRLYVQSQPDDTDDDYAVIEEGCRYIDGLIADIYAKDEPLLPQAA